MELSDPHYPRITANPKICFGKPRIKGSRMPVCSILAYLGSGMTIDRLLEEFKWLTHEDVNEAIAFAGAMMDEKHLPVKRGA